MRRLGGSVLVVLLLAGAVPSFAQNRPALEITVPTIAGNGAAVSVSNLLGEPDMRDLVRSGFPALLKYRLELWRGGFFDDLESEQGWEILIQYDPSAQRYRLLRRQAGKIEDAGSYATLSTAQTEIERVMRTSLSPARAGSRYYYNLIVEIEALSVSDMDQLERWLRGTKGSTAASAVGSGLRTLMLRMLGGERKRYTQRSPGFIAAERSPTP